MGECGCICTRVLCAYIVYIYACIYVYVSEETLRAHTGFPLHQLDRNTIVSYTNGKFSRHVPLQPGNILRFRFENSSFKYHFAAQLNV